MDHGRRTGIVDRDPAQGVRRDQKPGDGFPPWDAAQIAAYRARWPYGSVPRAAMELLFWTGCRVSDVVLIGPGHVGRDGVLAYRQGKTGGTAYVPWTCAMPPFADIEDLAHLRAALDAMPGGHMTWLATERGMTRSHKALGHLIARSAEAAGFDRSAHGLRKSRLASLAERGATTQQIMAWGGHASMSEVEHYTRSAARRSAVIGAAPPMEARDVV
jgi:integrase